MLLPDQWQGILKFFIPILNSRNKATDCSDFWFHLFLSIFFVNLKFFFCELHYFTLH